jgi:hypothetical protein
MHTVAAASPGLMYLGTQRLDLTSTCSTALLRLLDLPGAQ